ncbi:hypothetical protein VIGAN_10118300 [Vigna angularis var. angularis]|uniref:ESCRT-II complex subunit VPS25 n=1 Tax=Vigna angularis var. angularis TaxID=157739 RepID=A0A0S3T3M8_PHAAN|nr:hypothetical protein VIGAN_10118300 [Vigna angularis var. angularis]
MRHDLLLYRWSSSSVVILLGFAESKFPYISSLRIHVEIPSQFCPHNPRNQQLHVHCTIFCYVSKLGDFKLPHFFNYPPYFTLQPVRDTREKQIQLWKELILDYCKTQKTFVIALEEEFPLFANHVIERSLTHEAREAFLSALVSEGRAEWMDKGHRKCLILWHRIQDWADILIQFAKDNGLEDGVVTIEEIRSGTESQGTELHGIDRTILNRALKLLEQKGKLVVFKGTSADDEGIKFSI